MKKNSSNITQEKNAAFNNHIQDIFVSEKDYELILSHIKNLSTPNQKLKNAATISYKTFMQTNS